MTYYREWSRKFNDRTGTMIPIEQFANIIKHVRDPGYASVYAFKEEDAKQIQESGLSRDFSRFEAFSDTLPLDIDDGGESLPDILDRLSGLKYDLYTSGGKGMHIILHHEPIVSMDLPNSHKNVVESFGIKVTRDKNYKGLKVDDLYHHGRILSLLGRIHPKTGKKKELIRSVDGELVHVPITKKDGPKFDFSGIEGSIEAALLNLLNLKTNPPLNGNRHMRTWQTAMDLLKAGFDIAAIGQFLLVINEQWPEPQPEDEILAAVEQAARRLHG